MADFMFPEVSRRISESVFSETSEEVAFIQDLAQDLDAEDQDHQQEQEQPESDSENSGDSNNQESTEKQESEKWKNEYENISVQSNNLKGEELYGTYWSKYLKKP